MEWREIIFMVLAGIVFLLGSPIIQVFKNLLSKLVSAELGGRIAVLLAVFISAGIAALEMYLTGQFLEIEFSLETFPIFLTSVYSVAQIYYGWFKSSDSALGKRLLLK